MAEREGDGGRVVVEEQGGRHAPVYVSGAQHGRPQCRAGAASASAVLRGVGALDDMGGATLRGGGINTQAIRQAMGNIRSNAQGVKAAYNAVRGPRTPWSARDKISTYKLNHHHVAIRHSRV